MNLSSKNTAEIVELLNQLVGDISVKRLFTGHGLFYNRNIMFSIYKGGVFYLRAEHDLATYLESLGATRWQQASPGLSIYKYYRLPSNIVQDLQLYQKVIIASIQQVKLQKLTEELSKKERIRELANLTIKHERLLNKIGIHNVNEFRLIGPQNCYVRLKKANFGVSINIFWLFIAALKNKHVSLLSAFEKKQALGLLNIALTNAGLKPVKEKF